MTVHLFPTHPRLSQPVTHARGPFLLAAAVVSWLVLAGLVYGLMAIVQVLS